MPHQTLPGQRARHFSHTARLLPRVRCRPKLEYLEGRLAPATFVVNSTADIASPPAGVVTLRSAVLAANADPAPDTVAFDRALAGQTITLSLAGDGTAGPSALAVGGAGQPSAVTIDGSAAPGLVLSGPTPAAVLRLFYVAVGSGLTLENVTVSNFKAFGAAGGEGGGGGGAGLGGAIFNEGALTVQACTFSANQVAGGIPGAPGGTDRGGGGGGGLGSDGLPGSGIYRVPVQPRADGGNGGGPNGGAGGVAAAGAAGGFGGGGGGGGGTGVTISLVLGYPGGPGGFGGGGGGGGTAGSQAAGGAGGFGGGGGANGGAGGFGATDGTADGFGGRGVGLGGAIFNNGGAVTVLDSTFANNIAGAGGGFIGGVGYGGAIFSRNGAVAVYDSTLFGNRGGGIYALGDGATVTATVNNTILAHSSENVDFGAGAINGGAFSVSGVGDLVQAPGPGADQLIAPITGVDPLLGPPRPTIRYLVWPPPVPQDNGGPTPTLRPQPGSPVLNVGVNAAVPFGLATDQRGLPRVVNGAVDIGAVEAQPGEGRPVGVGAFDPSTGTWYLRSSNTAGPPDAGRFAFGGAGWLPVAGDWSATRFGTGLTGVGAFDPATATWYLRYECSAGAPDAGQFQYGGAGWLPVSGDWDNNGRTGIGAFDPATATWYLRNDLSAGSPDAGQFRFGVAGGVPVVGDWAGTGHLGIGVFDPATGTWYLRSSATPGAPDVGVFQFGGAGWKAVAGDWTGAGHAGVGAFDPATATWYLRTEPAAGAPDAGAFAYGGAGWLPVAGAFAYRLLLAAEGEGPGAAALSDAELQSAVAGALARLTAIGTDPALVGSLASVTYAVGALPPGALGLTDAAAHRITISADAAGRGWFADPTPGQDEEFAPGAPGSPLVALTGSPAAGKEDLVTAVLHEMGHLAGRPDTDSGLMAGSLVAGTRDTLALDWVFSRGLH